MVLDFIVHTFQFQMVIMQYCELPSLHELVLPSKLYLAMHEQTPLTHSDIEYVQSAFKVHALR